MQLLVPLLWPFITSVFLQLTTKGYTHGRNSYVGRSELGWERSVLRFTDDRVPL